MRGEKPCFVLLASENRWVPFDPNILNLISWLIRKKCRESGTIVHVSNVTLNSKFAFLDFLLLGIVCSDKPGSTCKCQRPSWFGRWILKANVPHFWAERNPMVKHRTLAVKDDRRLVRSHGNQNPVTALRRKRYQSDAEPRWPITVTFKADKTTKYRPV